MVVYPSFEAEYCVVLGRIWSKEIPRKVVGYELRWTSANQQIWHHEPIKGTNSFQMVPRKNPGITTMSVDFPFSAANEISKAWARILKQTKYPKNEIIGLDGVTYDFYASYNLYGRTWSPEFGAPFIMTELGEALIAYVKADPANREKALSACLNLAKKLDAQQYE